MVFVFDVTNNKVKLYINNSLVLFDNTPTPSVCTLISNTKNTTTIGFDGGRLGNFAFTDYRIYNRALDSAQVNALYTYVQ
jgi:hypothetical protein